MIFSSFLVRFLFHFARFEYTGRPNLVNDCIPVIVARFAFFAEDLLCRLRSGDRTFLRGVCGSLWSACKSRNSGGAQSYRVSLNHWFVEELDDAVLEDALCNFQRTFHVYRIVGNFPQPIWQISQRVSVPVSHPDHLFPASEVHLEHLLN